MENSYWSAEKKEVIEMQTRKITIVEKPESYKVLVEALENPLDIKQFILLNSFLKLKFVDAVSDYDRAILEHITFSLT